MSAAHSECEPGSIELVLGPMFAGKTTELLRRVKRWIYARKTCCIVKYSHDLRYSENCVATHDQQMIRATVSLTRLSDFGEKWREFDCIAVDEGQFFPDLAKFCGMAADAGKHVVVSALDGDFRRQPFGDVVNLIPMCENITKITAICMMCHHRDAVFTRRTVRSDKQELIGGSESYVAVCRACYNARDTPMTPRKEDYARACRVVDEITCKELLQGENEGDAKSLESALAALTHEEHADTTSPMIGITTTKTPLKINDEQLQRTPPSDSESAAPTTAMGTKIASADISP